MKYLFFQSYSVEQKRAVFFKFVELFHDQNFPQELKAKVRLLNVPSSLDQ